MTATFKYVGAHLDDLADGRVLEPGRVYHDIDETHPHNQRLITERLLLKPAAIAAPAAAVVDATEGALELAQEHGIDLAGITGSGQDGRVLKTDVETYLSGKES